jgi:hypothetical protein
LETHGFKLTTFDTIVSDVRVMATEAITGKDWDSLINSCSLISALSDTFPERQIDF